jgi:aminopeptidase N
MAALSALVQRPGKRRDDALAGFEARHGADPLVMDKWFAIQATIGEAETLARVEALMRHPAFSIANPNRVRALIGAFALSNQSQFHRADGAGYRFLADLLLAIDRSNPQLASRLATAFRTWRMMEPTRRMHADAALTRIARAETLSVDLSDIVERTLAG